MVTFAKRLRPSTKFEVRRPSRSEDTAHLVCQLSIYNSFPVIRTTIVKNRHFLRTPGFIFCLPWGRPCGNHASNARADIVQRSHWWQVSHCSQLMIRDLGLAPLCLRHGGSS